MNVSASSLGILGVGLVVAGVVGMLFAAPTAPPSAPVVHPDAKALERAMVEALLALFREDPRASRTALDRMAELSPRIDPDDERIPEELYNIEQAYHITLNGTRESAGMGRTDDAYDEFDWVQRTCRNCHTAARREGLLPPEGPLWPGS